MPTWFRTGFYGGLSVVLLIGMFLLWLWQPERQINRHTENFFHAIEHKDWERAADFIGNDYQDQWGYDRPRLLERAREVFRYLRGVRISSSRVTLRIDQSRAWWTAIVMIEADEGEVAATIKGRVNSLSTPFELEWRRLSQKPWDWKLVRISNSTLEIPADAY